MDTQVKDTVGAILNRNMAIFFGKKSVGDNVVFGSDITPSIAVTLKIDQKRCSLSISRISLS